MDLKEVVYRFGKYPFSFVRYGDGEFQAMLGFEGKNCDGHEYFPDMGAELRTTILEPRQGAYYYAVGPKVYDVEGWGPLMEQSGVRDWFDANMFLKASVAGELKPLTQALNAVRVLYVGPGYLWWGGQEDNSLAGLFRIADFIPTPQVNAWLYLEKIAALITVAVLKTQDVDVIGFSCGPVAKILIWMLYPTFGDRLSMVDFGSVFDPYVGRFTRKYHREMDVARLRKKNSAL